VVPRFPASTEVRPDYDPEMNRTSALVSATHPAALWKSVPATQTRFPATAIAGCRYHQKTFG